MIAIELALSLLLSLQQEGWQETTFHRIYLRNGNFLDGRVVSDKPNEVILQLKAGEMSVRRDQIDRVELMKLKSYNDKPIILATPKSPTLPTSPTGTPAPVVNTPEQVKRKVDAMMVRLQLAQGEKEFNIQELQALGEEAAVYLASKTPVMDLKMQDAAAAALINLKPTSRVIEVLEGLIGNASPSIRALAATVLTVSVGDAAKTKYLRAMLGDMDAKVRETVLGLIGIVEDEAWFGPMSALCADPDREVRVRALRATRIIAQKNNLDERLSRLMTDNLSSSDQGVRADAVTMLGGLGVKDAWRNIVPLLNDSETTVRASAAQALSNFAVPESGAAIASALGRETDRWAKIYLASAAQKLQERKAVEPLISWLGDTDEELKKVAAEALRVITRESFGTDRARWEQWLSTQPK